MDPCVFLSLAGFPEAAPGWLRAIDRSVRWWHVVGSSRDDGNHSERHRRVRFSFKGVACNCGADICVSALRGGGSVDQLGKALLVIGRGTRNAISPDSRKDGKSQPLDINWEAFTACAPGSCLPAPLFPVTHGSNLLIYTIACRSHAYSTSGFIYRLKL